MSMTLPAIGAWVGELAYATTTRERHREFVATVEQLGYRMVWIPEAFGREVMSHAALVLAESESLIVGTGIANIWARDAVAMANGARTLGEAFPGRFLLGVGVSHNRLVAARSGEYHAPLATLRRYLEQMREARWDGPPLPERVPTVVGALGPKALELSAELTDGVHPYLVTPEYTGRVRETVGKGPLVATEQAVVLTEDPEAGRAAARRHLERYLPRTNYRNSFRRQGFTDADMEGAGSDLLVDGLVAWGDLERVRARLQEHLDAGADHVAIQVLPVDDSDDSLRTLRALAGVLPLASGSWSPS